MPTILIVVGAFLMVTGEFVGDAWLANAGWTCVVLGLFVEVLYIIHSLQGSNLDVTSRS